jgi:hypothetical protein
VRPFSKISSTELKRLRDEPLIREHILKYDGGDFYRAILGRQALPNPEHEQDLIRNLDDYFHKHIDRKTDWLEAYRFRGMPTTKNRQLVLKGIPWRSNALPPKRNAENSVRRYSMLPGSIYYLRYKSDGKETFSYDLEMRNFDGKYCLIKTTEYFAELLRGLSVKLDPRKIYEVRSGHFNNKV